MDEGATETVVIPQSTSTHGIECLRSLSRRGVRTIATTFSESNPALRSRYCDESVIVPSPRENLLGYKDSLLSLAERADVRTIVPIHEADAYVLSKYRSEFEDQVETAWPPLSTLRIAHDRLRLVEAAKDIGVPVPETRLLSEVDTPDRDSIVKARYALVTEEYTGSFPSGKSLLVPDTMFLRPDSEIDQQTIQNRMKHDPIVQEFVKGNGIEYSCRVLCDRGEPIAFCMKHQLRGRSYAGGASVYRKSTYDTRVRDLSLSLLRSIEWHGIASVCFIRDEDTGEFKLTEINPRMPVSLSMDVRAGVDFPHYYWQLATDRSASVDTEYKTNVGTHDPIGETRYLRSIFTDDHPFIERPSFAGELRNVLTSLIMQPYFEYLYLDDPVPFFLSLWFRTSESRS